MHQNQTETNFIYNKQTLLQSFKECSYLENKLFEELLLTQIKCFTQKCQEPVNNNNQLIKKPKKEQNIFSQQRIRKNSYQKFTKQNEQIQIQFKKPFENFKEVNNPSIRVWMYIDQYGKEQGPFSALEMDYWYHHTYFKPSLKIKLIYMNEYHELQQLFSKSKSKKKKLKLKINKGYQKPKCASASNISQVKNNPNANKIIYHDKDKFRQQKTQIIKPKGSRFKNFRNRNLKSTNTNKVIKEVALEKEYSKTSQEQDLKSTKIKQLQEAQKETNDENKSSKEKIKTVYDFLNQDQSPSKLVDKLLFNKENNKEIKDKPQKNISENKEKEDQKDKLQKGFSGSLQKISSKKQFSELSVEERKHRNYLKRQKYKQRKKLKKLKEKEEKEAKEEFNDNLKESNFDDVYFQFDQKRSPNQKRNSWSSSNVKNKSSTKKHKHKQSKDNNDYDNDSQNYQSKKKRKRNRKRSTDSYDSRENDPKNYQYKKKRRRNHKKSTDSYDSRDNNSKNYQSKQKRKRNHKKSTDSYDSRENDTKNYQSKKKRKRNHKKSIDSYDSRDNEWNDYEMKLKSKSKKNKHKQNKDSYDSDSDYQTHSSSRKGRNKRKHKQSMDSYDSDYKMKDTNYSNNQQKQKKKDNQKNKNQRSKHKNQNLKMKIPNSQMRKSKRKENSLNIKTPNTGNRKSKRKEKSLNYQTPQSQMSEKFFKKKRKTSYPQATTQKFKYELNNQRKQNQQKQEKQNWKEYAKGKQLIDYKKTRNRNRRRKGKNSINKSNDDSFDSADNKGQYKVIYVAKKKL